jgi:hypothetical protein
MLCLDARVTSQAKVCKLSEAVIGEGWVNERAYEEIGSISYSEQVISTVSPTHYQRQGEVCQSLSEPTAGGCTNVAQQHDAFGLVRQAKASQRVLKR